MSTTELTLVKEVVEFGFLICGAVAKRKVSSTVGTESLDSTTVVTIMTLEWPVLVVRDCIKLAMYVKCLIHSLIQETAATGTLLVQQKCIFYQ